jgi:release factor glutamine methyltransferase
VGEALDWTVGYFEENAVETPRRSAEWLLSAATGLTRIELYAMRERPLEHDERARLRADVKGRATGMPLQYVTGEMPFRHLVLHVRPGVFIPRPETEVLVDVCLEHLRHAGPSPVVIDVCTGSGAVALSIAHETAAGTVWATDLAEEAVGVACDNARRIGVADRVRIVQGDLFGPVPGETKGAVALVVSNPPYVPSGELLGLTDQVTEHEPVSALDGGPDGLDVVRRIADEAGEWLAPGGLVAMEVHEERAEDALDILEERFVGAFVRQDLTGRDRIVGATKEA